MNRKTLIMIQPYPKSTPSQPQITSPFHSSKFEMGSSPPTGGASRARSGEQDASKGSFVHIVPLDPPKRWSVAGHIPVTDS